MDRSCRTWYHNDDGDAVLMIHGDGHGCCDGSDDGDDGDGDVDVHVVYRYEAVVPHGPTSSTHFIALSKVLPGEPYLEACHQLHSKTNSTSFS